MKMLNIIKFVKVKNNQYKVIFNNKEVLLYDDIVLKYELLLRKKISENELDIIIKDNKDKEAYYVSLKYLNIKMRSKKEIREYLKKKGFINIDKTIKELEDKSLINDEVYTKVFIDDNLRLTLDGKEKFRNKLDKLGIDQYIISKYLDSISNDIWLDRLDKLINKKINILKGSGISKKNKLFNYLLTNGYSIDMINTKLNNIDFKSNKNVLLNDYKKIKKSMERKNNSEDIEYKIRLKLYNKGYTKDEIDEVINNGDV